MVKLQKKKRTYKSMIGSHLDNDRQPSLFIYIITFNLDARNRSAKLYLSNMSMYPL
jgi:hypothetical protein